MSRKRRPSVATVGRHMAAKDDQTRRFAIDEVERYERDRSTIHAAFAVLRHYTRHHFLVSQQPDLQCKIDDLEDAIIGR